MYISGIAEAEPALIAENSEIIKIKKMLNFFSILASGYNNILYIITPEALFSTDDRLM
jgi:hypothetical protein